MSKNPWLLPALLAALAGWGPSLARAQPMEFTPQNGFDGESEGQGSLRMFLGTPRPFRVTSRGSMQSDGTFRLDQTINFQGDAPHERFWILDATGPNHYSATLSAQLFLQFSLAPQALAPYTALLSEPESLNVQLR